MFTSILYYEICSIKYLPCLHPSDEILNQKKIKIKKTKDFVLLRTNANMLTARKA